MLTYYGIPLALKALNQQWGTSLNINAIPAATFAIVAFAFNEAAYASETLRAAILSVNPGEIEAARSLGMTRGQVYRRVIIPNAAVVATPNLDQLLDWLDQGDFPSLQCRCCRSLCPSSDFGWCRLSLL